MCSCQWKIRPFIPISGKIARYALHGFSLPSLLAASVNFFYCIQKRVFAFFQGGTGICVRIRIIMCIYIYIYIYIHTHIYIYIYMQYYVCIYIYICLHIYIRLYLCARHPAMFSPIPIDFRGRFAGNDSIFRYSGWWFQCG